MKRCVAVCFLVVTLWLLAGCVSDGAAQVAAPSITQQSINTEKSIYTLFQDEALKEKITKKLPYMFQIADMEMTKGGKVGQGVGILREQILIALLISELGKENVDANFSPNAPEIDVKVSGCPVSIKTVTGNKPVAIKWKGDQKGEAFRESYNPEYDILLAQIKWEGDQRGGLFLIPVEVQREVLKNNGRENYLKLRSRSVEIPWSVVERLLEDKRTKCIEIVWEKKPEGKHDNYQRWIDLWEQEEVKNSSK